MLAIEQAKEYLTSVGITLPDFVLQALVESANSIEECLAANYPAGTAMLIQIYLVGLLSMAQADKYISSQSAPSGASRSFRYQNLADRWHGTYGLLRSMDKFGCATGLIPPDPTKRAYAGLWVAKGGCHE